MTTTTPATIVIIPKPCLDLNDLIPYVSRCYLELGAYGWGYTPAERLVTVSFMQTPDLKHVVECFGDFAIEIKLYLEIVSPNAKPFITWTTPGPPS